MKIAQTLVLFGFACISLGCSGDESASDSANASNDSSTTTSAETTTVDNQVIEASCGQCQFDMEGTGCDLAVRIDGKSYYVDGTSLDDHGDAHGEDGMCNCIREAKVTGEVKDGRFIATSFELQPK